LDDTRASLLSFAVHRVATPPVAVGAKTTLMVHDCPADRLVPQVVAETEKSPDAETEIFLSMTVSLLVRVKVC